ncbi:hypothetical protein SEA_CLOWN_63 [Gordonia phage Clown]|uniref:Uncharacterized protein n=1 Tax=Gordonia phage Clown TaxID=2759393 RepID=A0A7L7SII0_9CAUD|nr:hypothetical protein KNV25_gp63 [Gordonia phage Clown]QOC56061.1 hypothetical protein SEA_CLOWN_63 [Gordonia phage Clown]
MKGPTPMSTGPDHYREAERLLAGADETIANLPPEERVVVLMSQAQVHATLALAAATALSGVISNTVAPDTAINELAYDTETITAVNDWHESAIR